MIRGEGRRGREQRKICSIITTIKKGKKSKDGTFSFVAVLLVRGSLFIPGVLPLNAGSIGMCCHAQQKSKSTSKKQKKPQKTKNPINVI